MPIPRGIRRAIINEFSLRGLGASNRRIVAALASYGVHVDEKGVQWMRIELLKDDGARAIAAPIRSKPKRRPQKVPGKRPRRM